MPLTTLSPCNTDPPFHKPIQFTKTSLTMFERKSTPPPLPPRKLKPTLISGLRAKIDAHFHSSPLATQRKDFLALKADTPIEKKSHFTADVVGAAAAYEAFKAFERHEIHQGSKPTHARAKEVGDCRLTWRSDCRLSWDWPRALRCA